MEYVKSAIVHSAAYTPVCVFVEALIAWMATISFLFHTDLARESVTNAEKPRNCGKPSAASIVRVSRYFIDRTTEMKEK